ncbi:MAG TPA: DUF6658 family protein [Allocoleopsis sp.]
MKTLTNFFKQIQLRQVLTALLATVVLFVGTACSGTIQGARPDNPAVQMGGGNNPYKHGGDTNTNYNTSPDPKVSGKATHSNRDRAELPILSNQLIAAGDAIQYPGDSRLKGAPADEQHSLPRIGAEDFKTAEPGGQIQRESNIGDRIQDRLGRAKESFGKAGEFTRDYAEEAASNSEQVDRAGGK